MYKPRKILAMALAVSMCAGFFSGFAGAESTKQSPPTPIWEDREHYSFEERAAAMVADMSLSEKASQMVSGFSPAIPRLGIDWYGWWNEALHGVSRLQRQQAGNATTIYNTTSYPINLSMGSTWDPGLMYRVAAEIGDEAREVAPGNDKTLTFWSPTVNLNRDPRWGRSDESFGEDPYLAGKIASQFVNGMEGKDRDGTLLDENGYKKSVSTIKHYLGNNSETNRLNGSSNMTDTELREYYSKVFRNIVEESNVSSLMTSYNRVNGIPASLDLYTMDTLLRQTFGFDGYVTSDCDSVWIAYTGSGSTQANQAATTGNGQGWQIPAEYTADGVTRKITPEETIAWAINAGEDLDCNAGYSGRTSGFDYQQLIPKAVAQKLKTPSGLFDENSVDTSLLRLMTARMELGEFDDQDGVVSWYDDTLDRVSRNYGSDWEYVSAADNGAITITPERLALAREAGSASIVLLKNEPVDGKPLLPLNVPAAGSFKVAVVGHFAQPNASNSNMFLGGYSCQVGPSAYDSMITPYQGIKDAIQAVNPAAEVTFYKGFTGTATAAAQLSSIDPDAVKAAAAADLVIVYGGTDSGTANEQGDRGSLKLPGAQTDLIKQVVKANPRTVVVMETISPNEVYEFEGDTNAMLWSCYNSMQKGGALADILMGKYNPSARTSTIWPVKTEDLPNVRSYKLTAGTDELYGETPGRTYMYYTKPVEYPFGYGLSYSSFEFNNMTVDKTAAGADDTVTVTVDVKNTSAVDGSEVVQLYVATPDADKALQYPVKRLEGFEKVFIPAGQTKTVTLSVAIPDLAFFQESTGRYEVYNGNYEFQISTSSADVQARRTVAVSGAMTPHLSVLTSKPVQAGDEAADVVQRVIFAKNTAISPRLTVAMSDDTLYGYITKGQSKDLPEGMTVSYRSNRSEVAEVSGDTITTKAAGVATVTATVSYQGESVSSDFVVYVQGDAAPTDITLDGASLEGFDPAVRDYTVYVPYGTTENPTVAAVTSGAAQYAVEYSGAPQYGVPSSAAVTVWDGTVSAVYTIKFVMSDQAVYAAKIQVGGVDLPGFSSDATEYQYPILESGSTDPKDYEVTATVGDPSWSLEIKQPSKIPGTSTVTVKTGAGVKIYTIAFTTQAKSIDFANASPSEVTKIWDVLNGTDKSEIVAGKGLKLKTVSGDLYQTARTYQDVYMTSAPGDWDVVAKVHFPAAPSANYQQVALLAYSDSDHYAKVDVEYNAGLKVQSGVEKAAVFASNGAKAGPTASAGTLTTYLRMNKTGDTYTYYWSADGEDYTQIGQNTDTGLNNVQLAVYATRNSSRGSEIDAYVEYLHVDTAAGGHSDRKQWAVDNMAEAVADTISGSLTFPAGSNTAVMAQVPPSYSIAFDTQDGDVLAPNGIVTAPLEARDITFTFTVMDSGVHATSEPITVHVAGKAYKIESVVFNPSAMAEVDGDLRATVTISNTTAIDQTGLMMVTLYDADNRMVNYGSVGKSIRPGESETFETGFRVPFEKGGYEGYTAKVFVWDGTSLSNTNGIPLSGVTELS